LKRVWRDQEQKEGASGWRKQWREIVHGDRASRRSLARLFLDENPFVWLAGRDRQPATLGWLVVGGIVLTWLLCWAVWRSEWPSVPNFFLTATLLNVVLGWLARHTAAQEIGQPRRDGAYELLLTTPLAPSDIVFGTLEALRRHFKALANFVLSLNVLMMLGGLAARRWNGGALTVYFCVWFLLMFWTWSLGHRWSRVLGVMWASLNCARPAYAVWRTSGMGSSGSSGSKWFYWIWLWNIYNIRFWNKGFQAFPSGSPVQVVFVVGFTTIFLISWLVRRLSIDRGNVQDFLWDSRANVWFQMHSSLHGNVAEKERISARRLIREFREIVREPLPDPSDPRFKTWNVLERFPWGWGMVQQQLHERVVRELSEPLDASR
jgi:hypothetical protein